MDKVHSIEKYRPSNGTEGVWFRDQFCDECAVDRPYQDAVANDREADAEPCPILGATFIYNPEDDEYPREWRYVDGKPTCTAFERVRGPDEEPVYVRCSRTGDMFK